MSKKITQWVVTVLSAGAAVGLLLTGTASAATANHSHGNVTEAAAVTTSPSINQPWAITAGPDGALWFTNDGAIGRITTSGTITTFSVPGLYEAYGITAGPDGALWFTNLSNSTIGRITTSGQVTTYAGADIDCPYGITTGPDGALWFTNYCNNTIGRITTSGEVTDYTGAGISQPQGMTAGPDGALWFTNLSNTSIGSIGRITTSGTVTTYSVPGSIAPYAITPGPDGALWFTSPNISKIGRITTSGTVTSYTNANLGTGFGITAGPDGALWFTNGGNNSIGRVTTSGTFTNYSGTGISEPREITAGPDGALWFANDGNNSIGRITTSGQVTDYTGPPPAISFFNSPLPIVGSTLSDSSPKPSFAIKDGWTISDAGGVCSASVQRNQTTIWSHTGSTATTTVSAHNQWTHQIGTNDSLSAAATDCQGNASSASDHVDPTLSQEGAATYSAGWKTGQCACWSGGTVLESSKVGATAKFSFSGRLVTLISDKAPTRGKAALYIDGVYKKTVTLTSSTKANRLIAWNSGYLSPNGSHVLTVKAVSGRIDVDAFLVN